MTLSARDRKLVLILVPVVLLAAYWFLLLAPKREEAVQAGEALAKQEKARATAESQAARLTSAKASFATDYATLVRLGKAVPIRLDMPSLLVQLDSAARGTRIRFQKVAAGTRDGAAAAASAPKSGSGSGGDAAAGGPAAQSASGGAAEKANETKAQGDQQAAQSGGDAKTSSSSKSGAPVAGGAAVPASGACPPGLECVPLDFEFSGSFLDLSNFFHRLKRFVRVSNDRVAVGGRLMTVDSFKFLAEEDTFPKLKAEVKATVYLSPEQEDATAGASPQGPTATPAAAPAGGSTPPTAAATP